MNRGAYSGLFEHEAGEGDDVESSARGGASLVIGFRRSPSTTTGSSPRRHGAPSSTGMLIEMCSCSRRTSLRRAAAGSSAMMPHGGSCLQAVIPGTNPRHGRQAGHAASPTVITPGDPSAVRQIQPHGP